MGKRFRQLFLFISYRRELNKVVGEERSSFSSWKKFAGMPYNKLKRNDSTNNTFKVFHFYYVIHEKLLYRSFSWQGWRSFLI